MDDSGCNARSYQVCRICLLQYSGKSKCIHLDGPASNAESTVIKHKLSNTVPQINLALIPNSIICENCVRTIELLYTFTKKILQIEKYICTYIQKTVNSTHLFQTLAHDNKNLIDVDQIDIAENSRRSIKIEDIKAFIDLTDDGSSAAHSTNEHNEQDDSQNSADLTSIELYSNREDNLSIFDDDTVELNIEHRSSAMTDNNEDQLDAAEYTSEISTDSNSRYQCHICNFETEYKHILLLHITQHTPKRPYRCSKCDKQTVRICNIKKHFFKIHDDIDQFKCSHCGQTFKYKSCLDTHAIGHCLETMTTYIKRSNYKCIKCDYNCKRKNTFLKHLKIHRMAQRPHSCIPISGNKSK